MAEFNFEEIGHLNIDREYYNKLDVNAFSLMMKNPSYSYKFYWLEAIVHLVIEDVTETTFDQIIDEMIANAWYSVLEFHIHLSGIVMGEERDGLERTVKQLRQISDLPANASKVEIKNAIRQYNAELKTSKEQLTNMVPYRALAGFFADCDEKVDWNSIVRLVSYIEKVNNVKLLPYTLGHSSRLKKEVYFTPEWIRFIKDNAVSILGWIQYEKVKWLQNNNPEVPGLVYKLLPMDEKMRKLGKVHDLWDSILSIRQITDVFTGKPVNADKYDVDHFIPWSFVMNDELWNLSPMDGNLNSAKSNRLPKWESFFKTFADNQFILYTMVNDDSLVAVQKNFRACYRDNLHSIWASEELYRPGNTQEQFCNILEKNMRPVYDSAKRQGYQEWNN